MFSTLDIWHKKKKSTVNPETQETKETSPMTVSACCFEESVQALEKESVGRPYTSTGFGGTQPVQLSSEWAECSAVAILKFKIIFTDGPHFHFTLSSANFAVGPAGQVP